MAKDSFYNLSESKRNMFFEDFRKVFLKKPYKDIYSTDVIITTGISKATFYNYFLDINDFFKAYVEHIHILAFNRFYEILPNHKYSIFSSIKVLYKELQDFYVKKNLQISKNFFNGAPTLCMYEYSERTEAAFYEKFISLLAITAEGKKIGNISDFYTFFGTLVDFMIVSLTSEIKAASISEANKKTIILDSFDLKFNLFKEGFNALYTKKNKV